MTAVEIEYCVPCGFRDRAQALQSSVLDRFGERVDRVALVTGDGGVFRVTVDGDQVFDKATDDYDVDDIVDEIGQRMTAG